MSNALNRQRRFIARRRSRAPHRKRHGRALHEGLVRLFAPTAGRFEGWLWRFCRRHLTSLSYSALDTCHSFRDTIYFSIAS
jgi:hypothetical protein